MMTFIQFLQEMPERLDWMVRKRGSYYGDSVSTAFGMATHISHVSNTEYAGKLDTGHDLYKKEHPQKEHEFENHRNREFFAVHPETGIIHMSVHLKQRGNVDKVSYLSGSTKTTIKAHKFYEQLLSKGHIKALNSDFYQTKGGMVTWKKLAKYSNISMTRHKAFKPESKLSMLKPWSLNYLFHKSSQFLAKAK